MLWEIGGAQALDHAGVLRDPKQDRTSSSNPLPPSRPTPTRNPIPARGATATLAKPSLPLPLPTMHPFHAASSFVSATPEEGSFDLEPRPQEEEEEFGGAASSQSRGTRAGGENAGIRCQNSRRRAKAKAYCAHCCRSRGFVCPSHVKTTTPHVPASSQCSERQQQTTLAAVDVEPPIPSKRPRRRPALPSVAAAPTTTSSVDQPIETTTATELERFAQEVSLDAVFRRVMLGGGPEPEVAYYTTVTIAGHVFRGVLLLYDVGPSSTAASDTAGSGEVGSSLSTAGGSCLDLALGL